MCLVVVLIVIWMLGVMMMDVDKEHKRAEKIAAKQRIAEERLAKKRLEQLEHLQRVEEREREIAESWDETLEMAFETQPKLCIVVRTFAKHEKMLAAMLFSLINTEFYQNFLIVLTDTVVDYRQRYLTRVVELVDDPRVVITPLLKPYTNEERPPKPNTSGYEDTNAETDRLLKVSKEGDPEVGRRCDYFLYTNGDNQYAPGFLDRLHLMMLEDGGDKVWITFNFTCYVLQHRPMPSYGSIDLGASVISREVYETMPNLRFEDYKRFETTRVPWHDSDYLLHQKIYDKYQYEDITPHRLLSSQEILMSHL